jgi:hypothetical protein
MAGLLDTWSRALPRAAPFPTKPQATPRAFIGVLAAVAAYRLTLVGRGALAFVDETWYFKSVMTLQELGAGNVRGALGHIATTVARPGAVLIKLPVAALQIVPLMFGVAASNPWSLVIPQIFNVGVSLVLLYLFFDICLVLCGDSTASLVAAIVYALLVNTNLYIRHVLPYDWALCAGIGALWIGIRRPLTVRRALAAGLLVGAMIAIYPGCYLLAPVLCVGIASQTWRDGQRSALQSLAVLAIGAGIVLAAMELLCRLGGVSYLASARALSHEITTGGAFDEAWTFLPEYLVRVEGLPGLILLVAAAATLWRAVLRVHRRTARPIDWLLLPAVAAWAWQCAYSAQWHRIVMYGRLIHPWMLFLAWMLADAIAAIKRPGLRVAAISAVLGGTLLAWVPWARAYYRLAYPSDVLYALRIDTTRLPVDRMRCELKSGGYDSPTASPGPLDRKTRYPYTGDTGFRLVNFCQPIGILNVPEPPAIGAEESVASLVFDGPHWATFPAYGFEGVPPDARKALVRNGYRVRAYRLPAPPRE